MKHDVLLNLNQSLYLKNPQESNFGKKALSNGILLIDEIGFEKFTFKKLAQKINSAEASVYRYFVNKHYFLLYLNNWYWEWLSFLIDRRTLNIKSAKKKIEISIHTVANTCNETPITDYIDENVLHRIIIKEGAKSYHIHSIDEENKHGLFLSYKELVEKIAKFILEFNPKFKYSKSLVSNMFEMANNQIFFAEHLPRLTDIQDEETEFEELELMLNFFVFKLIS